LGGGEVGEKEKRLLKLNIFRDDLWLSNGGQETKIKNSSEKGSRRRE
jgi:hypothetical protein